VYLQTSCGCDLPSHTGVSFDIIKYHKKTFLSIVLWIKMLVLAYNSGYGTPTTNSRAIH
jgi:hypothetical protein